MIDYELPSAVGPHFKSWQWFDGSAWKDFDPPTCTSLDAAQLKPTKVLYSIDKTPHTANVSTMTLVNGVTGQTYKMQSNPPAKRGAGADLPVREHLAMLGIKFVDVAVDDPMASEQCVICMGELHEEGEGLLLAMLTDSFTYYFFRSAVCIVQCCVHELMAQVESSSGRLRRPRISRQLHWGNDRKRLS